MNHLSACDQMHVGRQPTRRACRYIVNSMIGLAFAGYGTMLLGLCWAGRPYLLDLLAQLLWPGVSVGLIVTVVLLVRRQWRVGAAGVTLLLLIVMVALAQAPPRAGSADRINPEDVAVRLITFNAQGDAKHDGSPFAQWTLDEQADIVVVIEAPLNIIDADVRQRFVERFAYRLHQGGSPGQSVFSRFPLEKVDRRAYEPVPNRLYYAYRPIHVEIDGFGRLLLCPTHWPSPRNAERWATNIAYAQQGGNWLRHILATGDDRAAIVAGDLNATPTARAYRAFGDAGGLRAATPDLWPRGTWPAVLPSILGLAVDHVWVSPDLKLVERRVGPAFDSDHRPTVSTILLNAGDGR